MNQHEKRLVSPVLRLAAMASLASCVALHTAPARAAEPAGTNPASNPAAEPVVSAEPARPAAAAAPAVAAPGALAVPCDPLETAPAASGYRLGAYAETDLGVLFALRQGAALAGGVVWGPFRAGVSYATFLSNAAFGGVPEGFSLRANYIFGLNAAYFIGQKTDEGLYVQAMFHIKQQGVTNLDTGDHRDLNSLAAGLELGYVWKVYRGLYVAPRVGALYYLKSPQGPDNEPIRIGDRDYDNDRHKVFDTYLIPTLSLGYSW